MKITIYGGPYDGDKYEVPNGVSTIVVPLPQEPTLEPPSTMTPTVRLPRAEIPIRRSVKYGYLADWASRREYE